MTAPLLLRTLRGENTDIKPVWMMRQAGRYLPEYREVRARFPDFLAFIADTDAAAAVTVQPVTRFDLDAAILFSDILVTLPPMGLDLAFTPGTGPLIRNPVQTETDVSALRDFDCEKDLAFTRLAIEKTKQQLPSDKPLLGFAGGPLTLASYAIEGKSSKDLAATKKLFYGTPFAYEMFLTRIAEKTGEYLVRQADWGCDALVLMDSWAGALSPEDYRRMALPYTQIVLEKIREKTDTPVIHYANGAPHLLPDFLRLNAQAQGLDWRTDLASTLKAHPGTLFQGNLDPAVLLAPAEIIRQRTKDILSLVKDRPHIMNLGHGVLPSTPLEGVRTFVETLRGI